MDDCTAIKARKAFLRALIGTSVALPFERGQILLGTWQRIVLVELDGPRERQLVLTVTAES
jgi:thiamine phosphate synthase YjbQ (UPF0047 family)